MKQLIVGKLFRGRTRTIRYIRLFLSSAQNIVLTPCPPHVSYLQYTAPQYLLNCSTLASDINS